MLVLPLLSVAGISLMLAMQAKRAETKVAVSRTDCSVLDQAASTRIAGLLGDASAHGELRFDEALAQLRRARRYCRSGLTAVAESNYRALEHAIPLDETASIARPSR
jgi:hypothetical protein